MAVSFLDFEQPIAELEAKIEELGAKSGDSCYGCHGGRAWYRIAYPYARNPWPGMPEGTPVLAGMERNHFVLQMKSFRSGERGSTVMHHHAKGLTEAEIEQLADYFAVQPRAVSTPPMPLGGLI